MLQTQMVNDPFNVFLSSESSSEERLCFSTSPLLPLPFLRDDLSQVLTNFPPHPTASLFEPLLVSCRLPFRPFDLFFDLLLAFPNAPCRLSIGLSGRPSKTVFLSRLDFSEVLPSLGFLHPPGGPESIKGGLGYFSSKGGAPTVTFFFTFFFHGFLEPEC